MNAFHSKIDHRREGLTDTEKPRGNCSCQPVNVTRHPINFPNELPRHAGLSKNGRARVWNRGNRGTNSASTRPSGWQARKRLRATIGHSILNYRADQTRWFGQICNFEFVIIVKSERVRPQVAVRGEDRSCHRRFDDGIVATPSTWWPRGPENGLCGLVSKNDRLTFV